MRLALLLVLATSACAQPPEAEPAGRPSDTSAPEAVRPAPYPCDGCEIVGEAPGGLTSSATLAEDDEPGDRLVLSGRVLDAGGTPASGVVLYFHQTDASGIYRQEDGGHAIQGWLQTDAEGRYRVETVRPGPYPEGGLPAHVHVYVGEPGRAPYYLNDFVFEGDPEVTPAYLAGLLDGPDTGVLRLDRTEAGWRGERDLVLAP